MHTSSGAPLRHLIGTATLLLAGWTTIASAQCGRAPTPDEVLRRINAERAHGSACRGSTALKADVPLTWSTELAAAAATQADEMVALHQMSHRDRANRSLAARLDAVGYRYSAVVENVAVGQDSVGEVIDAWLASDAHCANLMHADVVELGLACSDGGRGETDRYWSLLLGARRPH